MLLFVDDEAILAHVELLVADVLLVLVEERDSRLGHDGGARRERGRARHTRSAW